MTSQLRFKHFRNFKTDKVKISFLPVSPNLANRTNTGVASLKQQQHKVIPNQKLCNVYLFKYNSYFYHDMQIVSFDKVKGVNQINYM